MLHSTRPVPRNMAELVIRIHEYIGESCFNWDTFEFEWATNADDVRMAVEWAQFDGVDVTGICLEIGTCYGGSTTAGTEIYNYLKGLGLPIRTRILALAASMATVLPLVGDEVEIDQSAQLLVHGPSGWADGTVGEVASGLKRLSDTHAILRDIYVARTGQPVEVVEEWMSKDTWFTAAEALAVGLVTKVIPLAPKTAPVLSDAQASARRAKYAGITARASKRTVATRAASPKPKAKTGAVAPPTPMVKPTTTLGAAAKKQAVTKAAAKPAALTAEQKANAAAVAAFAKKMGVKATIEGAADVEEVTAEAVGTVLADGAGTLYTDGALAEGSEVFNDEALTVVTADGVYGSEDGRDITVAGGVVESIADTTDSEGEAEPAGTAAITAAINAALAPMVARVDTLTAQVEKFSKTVPPLPKAKATGSQVGDPKAGTPKAKGVLAGASKQG